MHKQKVAGIARERRALARICRQLCAECTHANIYGLPTAADLRETMDARYDELAALDMIIASYDQQGSLFLDERG